MALPVGTQLGRYTVLKPLVSGGMAEVLLARAQGIGGFTHHVVIKAIRANKSMEESFIKAFVDEARLAASLHHTHIVQVHDVGHEGSDYFFAMEYVHGENLRKLLTKVARACDVVPLEQVVTIVLAVAAGLHYAHQQNIVHRDVTPANILIGYDGNVKVTDFGIAKALLRSSELTKSGSMRGKVAYMAPEICLGRPIDRRSDIFSLGIVLYELCTSRRLFKGDTDFLIMTSIVNGKIPKPSLHRKDLPLDLEDLILKALAPKPELRFSSAEQLAIALEQVAVNNGIRISPPALGEYLGKLFGERPEPWLSDTNLEPVDVDFDGGGSGLALVDDDPARELSAPHPWPLPDVSSPERGEFADDQRTELSDPDSEPPTLTGRDEPPTLTGRELPPTSGFETNETTLIGDQADVDMLLRMSRIEARREPTTPTRRDATPVPRRDATPTPTPTPTPTTTVDERTPTPIPSRASTPTTLADETPPARAQTPALGTRGEPTPIPRRDATPAPWGTPASASGTPMAWSNEGDVPSLVPKSRRIVFIAAIAVPLVAIGVYVMTRDGDETTAPSAEPDAYVVPPPIDAETPDAPMATSPIDAAAPKPDVVAKPPATPKQPAKKPITKKPPLER